CLHCSHDCSHSPIRPLVTALFLFFSTAPATTVLYTLSLHDALPISSRSARKFSRSACSRRCCASSRETAIRNRADSPPSRRWRRSEEHTSELQSRFDLVCRLLLEKKKKKRTQGPEHLYTETTSRRCD